MHATGSKLERTAVHLPQRTVKTPEVLSPLILLHVETRLALCIGTQVAAASHVGQQVGLTRTKRLIYR